VLVAQLKAQKKVAALRKQLLSAPKAKKAAIKKQLKAAKAKLAKISRKVQRVSKAVGGKKSRALKAKIA
jgi:ABC-type Zn2+ transport system substrate-binding protein/surface adhesin